MSDFYVVCGAALLVQYCEVEVDDDTLAFVQNKSIRRHLLAANLAPLGTLNLTAFTFVVRNMLQCTSLPSKISLLYWRIPVSIAIHFFALRR